VVVDELEARFGELVAAAAAALEAASADPWVKGSRGQMVAHPGFAVAVRLDTVAVKNGGRASFVWAAALRGAANGVRCA
jgi:hypothetical protein